MHPYSRLRKNCKKLKISSQTKTISILTTFLLCFSRWTQFCIQYRQYKDWRFSPSLTIKGWRHLFFNFSVFFQYFLFVLPIFCYFLTFSLFPPIFRYFFFQFSTAICFTFALFFQFSLCLRFFIIFSMFYSYSFHFFTIFSILS